MSKQSSDFILSSLRSRILLAVAALVVFNSIFGLLGYLGVSFLIMEPVYAVVTAVAAMTAATAVFGWWLSNEILRPIEAVSLLARSLERSPSASLPKTTGSSETDELLSSLHRNSQQLQNLIGLMDDVASGKTDAAMAPLQNPDRLSVSFQKLVLKVIESIKAKQQLDALQTSVNRLKSDVSGVRSGDLSVEFRGDLWQVGEIADAFKFVVGRLSEIVQQAASGSAATKEAADEARRIVRSSIDEENARTDRLARAVSLLNKSPERFTRLTQELESVVDDVAGRLNGKEFTTDARSSAFGRMRSSLSESRKQLEQLRERANAVPQAARRTEEIVRRSNLIALNAALTGSSSDKNSLMADEVAALSLRAEDIHKEIIAFNESLVSDVSKLDDSLRSIWSELPEIADADSRQHQLLSEVDAGVGKLEAIKVSLKTYAGEYQIENEAIVKTLETQTKTARAEQLKLSEQNLETIINAADTLRDWVSEFRPASGPSSESRTLATPAVPAEIAAASEQN